MQRWESASISRAADSFLYAGECALRVLPIRSVKMQNAFESSVDKDCIYVPYLSSQLPGCSVFKSVSFVESTAPDALKKGRVDEIHSASEPDSPSSIKNRELVLTARFNLLLLGSSY